MKRKIAFFIICIILVIVACKQKQSIAAIVYQGSMETSNIVNQIYWDEHDKLALILDALNGTEDISFDTSQSPNYILEIKNRDFKGHVQPSTFFSIWIEDEDSVVLHCTQVTNGTSLNPQLLSNEHGQILIRILLNNHSTILKS